VRFSDSDSSSQAEKQSRIEPSFHPEARFWGSALPAACCLLA
jgi:hypothetical protein